MKKGAELEAFAQFALILIKRLRISWQEGNDYVNCSSNRNPPLSQWKNRVPRNSIFYEGVYGGSGCPFKRSCSRTDGTLSTSRNRAGSGNQTRVVSLEG
ncbi:Glycerol-3-phosphate dehydrogenase mitochondrial [Bienertia sinuspersici]